MSAQSSGWWRPPIFTTARITIALVAAALAFPLFLFATQGIGAGWGLLVYLGFAILTARAVHAARRDAGSWFRRRALRRGLVIALLADCAAIVAAPGAVLFLLIALVLLNVALGWATLGMATAPDRDVDERQESLRNRSHRIAYWAFGLLAGGALLVAQVAGPASRAWAQSAVVSGGTGIAFIELLFVLPGMVVAWLEPDHIAPETAVPPLNARSGLALGMLAITIAWPALLSVALVLLPVHTDSAVRTLSLPASGRCVDLMATAQVGVGVEAQIPVHAAACGDGRTARAVWGLNQNDCWMASSTLASVTSDRCGRTVDPDGTLRFTYGATVRPALLPFLSREVTMRVVVDRDGRVVRFP